MPIRCHNTEQNAPPSNNHSSFFWRQLNPNHDTSSCSKPPVRSKPLPLRNETIRQTRKGKRGIKTLFCSSVRNAVDNNRRSNIATRIITVIRAGHCLGMVWNKAEVSVNIACSKMLTGGHWKKVFWGGRSENPGQEHVVWHHFRFVRTICYRLLYRIS